jgi:hypothetical protein
LERREIPGFSIDNATLVLQDFLIGEGSNYDANTRPGFGQGATKVAAQFQIDNLYDLDPGTATFTMDLRLRLYWIDPRLVVTRGEFPDVNGSD